jgi:hypothetical protein
MLKSHNLQKCEENSCAICGGKFGLVRYYSWRTALCSKRCRERFKVRQEGNFKWLRGLHAV